MAGQGRELRVVDTRERFDWFLEDLLDAERLPLVVVSIPEGAAEPIISVDDLAVEVGDAARLYLLQPHATFWLTDAVGRAYSVYSGWVRVYPARPSWRDHRDEAPLLAARAHKRRWLEKIVESVLNAAFADGYRPDAVTAGTGERDSARVEGVSSATHVFVRTERGGQAIMRANQLWPGISAERLVARGQRFDGVRLPGNLFDDFVPERPLDDLKGRAVEFVGDGIVTSAKVAVVGEDRAELLLHPDLGVTVSQPGLRSIIKADEVVTVEVIFVDGSFEASFTPLDPEPAMSVFPGGPPWLVPETVAPSPVDVPHQVIEDEADQGVVGDFEREIERLEQDLERERASNSELRKELREQGRLSVPKVYADPKEQLKLELFLSYLSRVPEADRNQYAWPTSYRIGDDFPDLVDRLVRAGGIQRDKVVEVCAEVLCGRAQHMPVRAVKEWRESKRGPTLKRADGAIAWRVRLQNGAKAARRLRYWRLPSDELELDWVGVHDAELR